MVFVYFTSIMMMMDIFAGGNISLAVVARDDFTLVFVRDFEPAAHFRASPALWVMVPPMRVVTER